VCSSDLSFFTSLSEMGMFFDASFRTWKQWQ